MCEVLPPIHESCSPSPEGENSKLEQLMINMLEERDKLMEKLRECQESYSESTKKLSLVEADNGILMRQLQALMPDDEERLMGMLEDIRASGGLTNGMSDDVNKWPVARTFAQLARELAAANEKIVEKEEEVGELKSERSNTRLLLEHLECLVARHERSLRMTVIKRQTSNAGVSSEVEVLKALKSLFDHHKALDEKVRERLRSAQERNVILEDELMLANQEIKTLRDNNKRMKRLIQQRNSVRMSSIGYDNFSFTKEQLAMLEERDQTIGDLQFSLDERTAQLEEAMHMQDELSERVQELEEELAMALTEVNKTKDTARQLAEAMAEQSRLQNALSEVQFELNESSQELATANESNQQLNGEVDTLKTQVESLEKELAGVRGELTQRSHALNQAVALKEDLLQQQNKELSQAEQDIGTAEHQIQSQRDTIHSLQQELSVAQEKERINEKNVGHLQSTVDRMLNEAKERLRTHSAERKALMEEKMAVQKKYDDQRKTLKITALRNKDLSTQVTELQNQLNSKRDGEGATANGGVVLRNRNTQHSSSSSKPYVRYSWQVTDIDDAIEKEEKSVPSGAGSSDITKSEEGEWDVSQLVSMLENQVSKLDKQLETMDESMAESEDFDRVVQGVTDGTYRPSPSAGMETFPHSNPPPLRHKKKFQGSDVVPKSALYRVSLPPSLSPGNSPTSTASNESIPSVSTKKATVKHRPSFSKLFHKRKSNGHKKASVARRASAPLPKTTRDTDGLEGDQRESVDFTDLLDSSEEREENRKKKAQLLFSVLEEGIPFRKWNSKTLVAWLEVWVGVPFWYIAALRNCLDNGETLVKLTDTELEQELGITNTLHRLKLRLAIQEILTVTGNAKSHRTTSPYGEMAHDWIGDYWLPSLGLSQYKEVFKACLVDARMLEYLTKRDLRTALKMVDGSHRNSLQYGISVLKKLDYSRQALESKRNDIVVKSKRDVILWTSDHVIEWVESLGLECSPECLQERGVHGGVLALDNDYGYEKLAMALQIPLTDIETRRQLRGEYLTLLCEGTKRTATESQSHGKLVRRLSKRLKVGSRTRAHQSSSAANHHSEFQSMRPPSPVLVSTNPVPLHMQSLMEEEGESSSSLNTSSASNYDSRTQTPTEFTT